MYVTQAPQTQHVLAAGLAGDPDCSSQGVPRHFATAVPVRCHMIRAWSLGSGPSFDFIWQESLLGPETRLGDCYCMALNTSLKQRLYKCLASSANVCRVKWVK